MDFNPAEIADPPTTGVRRVHETPLVEATPTALKGYGELVEDPDRHPIEIVRWPAQGWRPIDENSGDQGGITEGIFEFWWKGQTLFARNNAVGDSYLFAWSTWPEEASDRGPGSSRERALIWRANYHPDGGQLIYPLNGESFVVPLALPGDDVTPERFVTFWCSGACGTLHPPECLARRVRAARRSRAIQGSARPRARARLRGFRQGIRLLSRLAAAPPLACIIPERLVLSGTKAGQGPPLVSVSRALVDQVLERLTVPVPVEVLDEEPHGQFHPIGIHRAVRGMRRDQYVFHAPQRGIAG